MKYYQCEVCAWDALVPCPGHPKPVAKNSNVKHTWHATESIIPDGPYKCSNCDGAAIIEAALVYVKNFLHFYCPYCGVEISTSLDTTQTKIPLHNKGEQK